MEYMPNGQIPIYGAGHPAGAEMSDIAGPSPSVFVCDSDSQFR